MKDQLEFWIKTIKLVKVAMLSIFKEKPSKLKMHLTKIIIYIKHNINIFKDNSNKITFAIFYLKEPAFDYIKIFFRDFQENGKNN